MADEPLDHPLPASVADMLKQLTELASPQPSSATYNLDWTVPETSHGTSSNADHEAGRQTKPNSTPNPRIQGHISAETVKSNRATALSSQPAYAVDYLAELRKIT